MSHVNPCHSYPPLCHPTQLSLLPSFTCLIRPSFTSINLIPAPLPLSLSPTPVYPSYSYIAFTLPRSPRHNETPSRPYNPSSSFTDQSRSASWQPPSSC